MSSHGDGGNTSPVTLGYSCFNNVFVQVTPLNHPIGLGLIYLFIYLFFSQYHPETPRLQPMVCEDDARVHFLANTQRKSTVEGREKKKQYKDRTSH